MAYGLISPHLMSSAEVPCSLKRISVRVNLLIKKDDFGRRQGLDQVVQLRFWLSGVCRRFPDGPNLWYCSLAQMAF